VETRTTPRPLLQKKLGDSLPIHMIPSVVSVLVVAQSISEIPEGLMNNPVYNSILYYNIRITWYDLVCIASDLRLNG